MKLHRHLLTLALVGFALGCDAAAAPATSAGSWKTIYYKRVFIGKYNASWAGGNPAETVLRQRLVMPVEATQARVWLRSARDIDVMVGHIGLAPGVDSQGRTDGRNFPLTFAGSPGVKIEAMKKDFSSDELAIPIKPGVWYLQQHYASDQFLYTQDVDGYHRAAAVEEKTPAPGSFHEGSAVGNICRVDVFTTSPQMVVACYGDSITQGHGGSAGSGNRYPELLGAKIGRPVLNLGVNGDLAKHSRGLSILLNNVQGVDTVVFMIGINDIISGSLATAKDYADNATALAESVRQSGRKFYIGTIPPAGGYAKYDESPEKEELRQAVNAWIRGSTVADGIIDFDAALSNPVNSTRMRADYQSDWLHPNDAGYRAMAEAAAKIVR